MQTRNAALCWMRLETLGPSHWQRETRWSKIRGALMRIRSKKRAAWAWGGLSKVTGQGGRKDRKVNFEDLVIVSMCQFHMQILRRSSSETNPVFGVVFLMENCLYQCNSETALRLPLHAPGIRVLFAFPDCELCRLQFLNYSTLLLPLASVMKEDLSYGLCPLCLQVTQLQAQFFCLNAAL